MNNGFVKKKFTHTHTHTHTCTHTHTHIQTNYKNYLFIQDTTKILNQMNKSIVIYWVQFFKVLYCIGIVLYWPNTLKYCIVYCIVQKNAESPGLAYQSGHYLTFSSWSLRHEHGPSTTSKQHFSQRFSLFKHLKTLRSKICI